MPILKTMSKSSDSPTTEEIEVDLLHSSSAKLDTAGGIMSGSLNMNGNRITNVGEAIEMTDVIAKVDLLAYDNQLHLNFITPLSVNKFSKSGDKLDGDLDLNNHKIINLKQPPIDNNDITTKRYVDKFVHQQILKAQADAVNIPIPTSADIIDTNLDSDLKTRIDSRYLQILHAKDELTTSVLRDVCGLITGLFMPRVTTLRKKVENFDVFLRQFIELYQTPNIPVELQSGSLACMIIELKYLLISTVASLPQNAFERLKTQCDSAGFLSKGIHEGSRLANLREFMTKYSERFNTNDPSLSLAAQKTIFLIDIGLPFLL